jgi:hypothetical protein
LANKIEKNSSAEIKELRRVFNEISEKQKKRDFIKRCCVFLASSFLVASAYSFSDETAELIEDTAKANRLDKIARIIGSSPKQSCIESQTKLGPSTSSKTGSKKLTTEQTILKKLITKMDETKIGKVLNNSASNNNVIWCIDPKESGNYGYYLKSVNMAAINYKSYGDLEYLQTENGFHNALRTAYEENAHAWQQNERGALEFSLSAHPMHDMTHRLAVEADARVTTFLALSQHRQQGDLKTWQANYERTANMPFMKVIETQTSAGNLDVNITAQSLFKMFYEQSSTTLVYQSRIKPEQQRATHKYSLDYFSQILGFIPGETENYLKSSDFNPEIAPYNTIKSNAFLYRVLDSLIKLEENPFKTKGVTEHIQGSYDRLRINNKGKTHFVEALMPNGKWATISTYTITGDTGSPYFLDKKALEQGFVFIYAAFSNSEPGLVVFQKTEDLKARIEDLRNLANIPDYDESKKTIVEYKKTAPQKVCLKKPCLSS